MIPNGWRVCSFGEEFDEIWNVYKSPDHEHGNYLWRYKQARWQHIGLKYEFARTNNPKNIIIEVDRGGMLELTNVCCCLAASADGRFFSFRFTNE